MTAAWKTRLPATIKMVLLALCDNANDQGECYPSVSMLSDKCSLSDRAVQRCITDLCTLGFMARNERSGRSTLYAILAVETWPADLDYKPNPRTSFTPERRSPPNVVHPTPERGAPITINEPSIEPSRNRKSADAPRPDSVPAELWADFLLLRRTQKAPVTATALRGIEREAAKAGVTLADALAECCERSWRGFKAAWMVPNARASPPASRHSATIAALTGRTNQEYVDVESRTVPTLAAGNG